MAGRLVLAYSGGPASTAALASLAAEPGAEVVAVALGLGQGRDLDGIRARALGAGALRCHVLDLEAAFATDIVWPAVRAGVDLGLSAAALMAPIVARSLAEMAAMEQASGVAHGATGVAAWRLERVLSSLAPQVGILAAAPPGGREAHLALLDAQGLSMSDEPLVAEASLWGRRVSGPGLADTWADAPEDAFVLTRPAAASPAAPATLVVDFERGLPTSVNGVAMPLVELLDSVGIIAGAHGVGRADEVAHDVSGRPHRVVRESPALTVLAAAHAALEAIGTAPDHRRYKIALSAEFTRILEHGLWFSSTRRSLEAAIDVTQAPVTGRVRLTLFKGACRVAGRELTRYDS